jgi:hypothetical protein
LYADFKHLGDQNHREKSCYVASEFIALSRIREDIKGQIRIREDTKGQIRIREDIKGEIRIR